MFGCVGEGTRRTRRTRANAKRRQSPSESNGAITIEECIPYIYSSGHLLAQQVPAPRLCWLDQILAQKEKAEIHIQPANQPRTRPDADAHRRNERALRNLDHFCSARSARGLSMTNEPVIKDHGGDRRRRRRSRERGCCCCCCDAAAAAALNGGCWLLARGCASNEWSRAICLV